MPARKKKTVTRRSPRQRRSKELVSVIPESTAQILEREGCQGCTTNRVASHAGVSIGSLYQYFPDKEALISAVFSHHIENNLREFDGLIAKGEGKIIESLVSQFFERKKLIRVLLEDAPASIRVQGVVRNRVHFVSTMTEILRREKLPNPETAAFVIVHAIIGTLHGTLLPEQVSPPPQSLAQELRRLVERYVTA